MRILLTVTMPFLCFFATGIFGQSQKAPATRRILTLPDPTSPEAKERGLFFCIETPTKDTYKKHLGVLIGEIIAYIQRLPSKCQFGIVLLDAQRTVRRYPSNPVTGPGAIATVEHKREARKFLSRFGSDMGNPTRRGEHCVEDALTSVLELANRSKKSKAKAKSVFYIGEGTTICIEEGSPKLCYQLAVSAIKAKNVQEIKLQPFSIDTTKDADRKWFFEELSQWNHGVYRSLGHPKDWSNVNHSRVGTGTRAIEGILNLNMADGETEGKGKGMFFCIEAPTRRSYQSAFAALITEVSLHVDAAPPSFRFGLIVLDEGRTIERFPPTGPALQLTPMNKKRARKFLAKYCKRHGRTEGDRGADCIEDALSAIIRMSQVSRANTHHILYIGEGDASCAKVSGRRYFGSILSLVKVMNYQRAIVDTRRIDIEGADKAKKRFFELLAETNGGTHASLGPPSQWKVSRRRQD